MRTCRILVAMIGAALLSACAPPIVDELGDQTAAEESLAVLNGGSLPDILSAAHAIEIDLAARTHRTIAPRTSPLSSAPSTPPTRS